jgi:hypothetical protein
MMTRTTRASSRARGLSMVCEMELNLNRDDGIEKIFKI